MTEYSKGEAIAAVGDVGRSIFKDLLVNQYQMILWGGAAAASIIGMTPVPLIALFGVECLTLPLLDSGPIRRMVNLRKAKNLGARERERIEKLAASLDKDRLRRYRQLEASCNQIRSNYEHLSGISKIYLEDQNQKLDAILSGCLHRLAALQKYDEFLESRNTFPIEKSIHQIEKELESKKVNARARTALEKSLELKKKLLQSQSELESTRQAFAAELDSLASLLELFLQKSISIRDPQEVSMELDTIVRQIHETDRSVREIEAVFSDDLGALSALQATA